MGKAEGFTLIELLIVIGIVAILAVAVVMSLNPNQLLSQTRDGRRLAEVVSLDKAIALALVQNPDISLGTPNRVYLSLPNLGGGADCADYSTLPPLTSPWQYVCAASSTFRKVDGTGWIPINFGSLPMIPLDNLAVDPINDAQKGLYYSYTPGEINTQMESHKYEWGGSEDRESVDEGNTIVLYEKGPNLNAAPKEVNARILAESKVDVACSISTASVFTTTAWYNRWTIGSGLSGKAVVVRLLYYDPDGSLGSSEAVEMAFYGDVDGSPKLSESVMISGTGVAGWSSRTLTSFVEVDLGQTYRFGIIQLPTVNFARDSSSDCAGYPPSGSLDSGLTVGDDLSPTVPGTSNSFHVGFVGVVYAKN